MFNKFKILARTLFVILVLNFVVFNFGIEPKEAKANTILDINSTRTINYDLKKSNDNFLIFDFSQYLTGDDKIDQFVIKDGQKTINGVLDNSNKKICKVKFFPINKQKYIINVTATINGQTKKLLYEFIYNDFDSEYNMVPTFNSNNLELKFDEKWLALFNDDETVSLSLTSGNLRIFVNETDTIKNIKANQNKKTFNNKKKSFSHNVGYFLDVTIRNRVYRWKIYVNKDGSKISSTSMNIESGEFVNGTSSSFNVVIKDKDIKNMTTVERFSGNQGVVDTSKKHVKFSNESAGIDTDQTIIINKGDNEQREGKVGICKLNYFEKLNYKASILSLDTNNINVEFSDIENFISKDNSKNKIIVYELEDNFSKNKIGELSTGVNNGTNTVNIGSKVLSTNKTYLVELTDGVRTISTSFIYTPMNITVSDQKQTSVKVGWTYPIGYTPVAGDKVEIFLRDKNASSGFPAVAKVSLVQGIANVNLSNITNTIVTNIAPSTNYEAKVVLSNARGSVVSYKDFTTLEFKLKDYIKIKDSMYRDAYYKEAYPRSRNITVEWDFQPENMDFSEDDKVEIFIKPNGSGEFSGYPNNDKYKYPAFRANSDLRNVKKANITLPSWMTNFHVDLIYTIGGKQIITSKPAGTEGENAYNRRTVYATVNPPHIEVTDITQTSAKVKWKYDNGLDPKYEQYKPENGHIIKLYLKKINSINDHTNQFPDKVLFHYTHGEGNMDISKVTEFELKDLEPDQAYRMKLTHLVQHPDSTQAYPGFDNKYRGTDNYYNFQTGSFAITDLKAEQINKSPNVNLTWNTTGAVTFGEEDVVKVYLKESTTSEYPETAIKTLKVNELEKQGSSTTFTESERPQGAGTEESPTSPGAGNVQNKIPKNNINIELPKYNTTYNVKVEYTVKGKKVIEYVLAEAKGEIQLNITDIKGSSVEDWVAKIKWVYPEGYPDEGRENDKVQLTVVKKIGTSLKIEDKFKEFKDKVIDTNIKEENLSTLKPNTDYDVILKFMNKDTKVYEIATTFRTTTDLQIIGLIVNDIKSKTATMKWDYSPQLKEFGQAAIKQDKVEIYIKYNKPNLGRTTPSSDDLTTYKKIYVMTHDAKKASSYAIDQVYDQYEAQEIQKVKSDVEEDDPDHSRIVKVNDGDLKNFKSLNLTDLGVNKDYTIKIKYTVHERPSHQIFSQPKISYAEFSFKTKVDTFKSTVYVSNQTSATYGWEYPPGYTIKDGDTVKIYVKEVDENGKPIDKQEKNNAATIDYGDPLLTLTHKGETNLNEITRVDVSGLTPERKYKSKIEFTMGTGENSTTISSQVDISTKAFNIKSFSVDSYQEYDILAKWEVEPENMVFSPGDKAEIFVKLATDTAYPADPVYKLTSTPIEGTDNTINNTFSDYVEALTIGKDQKMKLVYTVGKRTYEKELDFNNKISDIDANVVSVDETRAIVGVTAPDNYEFVHGDKLLIYAKDEFAEGDVQNQDFLVFEGVESDTLSIPENMKSIELSYLLPEAKYEVLIALELQDGSVQPKKLEFSTKPLPVTDIILESLKHNNAVISWDYGDNKIDFFKDDGDYDFTDKLVIAQKQADGTPFKADINELKKLKHVEYLGPEIESVKNTSIEVEDASKDYDVAVCYELGGLLYLKQYKVSYLSSNVSEDSITPKTAKVNWKYPSNINVEGADKTEISVRKKSETSYPASPASTVTGSGTTSYTFEGLEGNMEYVARIQLTKEGLAVDPVEVEFKTKEDIPEEVIVENVDYEIKGTAAEFGIPNSDEIQVDASKEIGLSMGEEAYKGFTVKFTENGTGFVIEPTIPKKKYTNIEVELPLKDGKTYKMVIKEFVTQPENVTQEWLSNAYWFAFERFPDEEGYGYWYKDRMLKKTLNGEYFLKNLMFAEDEFTNRNLSDNDLIAALYQIVVNREFDQEGLNFWIGIYNENLKNSEGNKKLSQEVLVDRMVHEAEFGKLCEKAGIFWRQSDQDAAGVVA